LIKNQLPQFSELMIDCCLMPNEQIFSYIMARTSYSWWNVVKAPLY